MAEKDWQEVQEVVFNKLIAFKYRLQSLAGFVQNDYARMLADGHVTKGQILENSQDAHWDFERAIHDLQVLQSSVQSVLGHYGEAEVVCEDLDEGDE